VPLKVKKKLKRTVSHAELGQVTQINNKIENSRSIRDLTLKPVKEENHKRMLTRYETAQAILRGESLTKQ
jgi:uncharacterized membrane protein